MKKVDYEELMGYYKAFRYGHPGDGEYEDAIESIVWLVPDIMKDIRKLEAENAELRRELKAAMEKY